MMGSVRAAGTVLLGIALAACGRQSTPERDVSMARAGAASIASAPPSTQAEAGTTAPATPSAGAPVIAQKLIHTATLEIELDDVTRGARAADSIARQHGGMVTGSRIARNPDDGREADLVIRVPSTRFAESLDALRKLGDVRSESDSTEDVTRQYTDLATRLAVQEQAVARLRALLDQRGAKLSDILEIERELTNAVSELEQMKGEQRYYDQQIAMSTITLTLFDHATARDDGFVRPIRDAFRDSVGVIGKSLAAVVYLVAVALPWAILALIVWWIYVRYVRKRPPATPQVIRRGPLD